ncbi:MAG: hypothetical protein WBM00_04855 [Solirubrobacterales bacterium]
MERMLGDDLKVTDGASAGGWIKPRLGGEFGAVTLQVPKGYEAYARIFHPAQDQQGNSVRWEEVAGALGTTAHREMQWHAIVGCSDVDELPSPKWPGSDPMTGQLYPPELDALCEILATHTSEPDNCFFGLCTILAWTEDVVPPKEQEPLLKLPWGRDHVVLQGPLSAVDQIGYRNRPRRGTTLHAAFVAPGEDQPEKSELPEFSHQMSPNLIWPPDQSWLVASEVDFDSTLIGGSAKLINAIVESSALEAWRVEPPDSLAADADRVNVVSETSD